eukprot:2513501-Pyramimonas_sp.AAC.1
MFNRAVTNKHEAWVKFASGSFQRGASRAHQVTRTQELQEVLSPWQDRSGTASPWRVCDREMSPWEKIWKCHSLRPL